MKKILFLHGFYASGQCVPSLALHDYFDGHKIKTVEQVSNASDITPSWFKEGVEAALLAPTAVNQQKCSFEHIGVKNNCHQIRAKKGFSMIGYTKMDLGIAKYHFEIGAGKVNFEWV